MAAKKETSAKGIIRREFARKREQLIRDKQLDITFSKRHQGIDSFKTGDMKPFVKETKRKLTRARRNNLIK